MVNQLLETHLLNNPSFPYCFVSRISVIRYRSLNTHTLVLQLEILLLYKLSGAMSNLLTTVLVEPSTVPGTEQAFNKCFQIMNEVIVTVMQKWEAEDTLWNK